MASFRCASATRLCASWTLRAMSSVSGTGGFAAASGEGGVVEVLGRAVVVAGRVLTGAVGRIAAIFAATSALFRAIKSS
jgi:hypothetical protein